VVIFHVCRTTCLILMAGSDSVYVIVLGHVHIFRISSPPVSSLPSPRLALSRFLNLLKLPVARLVRNST
jgi:hypothetical protein